MDVNPFEAQEEEYKTLIAVEELEQFLCCIGLREELFKLFLNKGLNSIEKLSEIEKFNFNKTILNNIKKEIIINNISLVYDKINSYYQQSDDEEINLSDSENNLKPSFLQIIRETFYDLKGVILIKETMMQSFKVKNKPNNYLPKDFKEENITADKIYASFLQDKKISNFANLDGFRNLRHLFLNNNKIQKLEKLNFPNLMIYELSNNFIRKIENLEMLINLETLNLEKNLIFKLENLGNNIRIENLNLSKQILTRNQKFEIAAECLAENNILKNLFLENCGVEDPSKLSFFTNLIMIKLNNNKIQDLGLLVEGLKSSKDLENLFISNNPFTDINKSYRDIIVIRCPNLINLDNKAITKNEKMYVNSLYSRKFGKNKTITHNNNINSNKHINFSGLSINVHKLDIDEERKNKTLNKIYK